MSNGTPYYYQGAAEFGRAITSAIDRRDREGKLAQALRRTLDIVDEENKAEHAAMGLPDLQGKLEGMTLRNALAREKKQADYQSALIKEMQSREQQRTLGQALQEQAAQGVKDIGMRTMAGEPLQDALSEAMATNPQLFVSPQGSELLNALARVQPRGGNEIPVSELGVPRPMPGREDIVFVPTSTGGGQVLPKPGTAGTGKPQEAFIGDKSTGWALFPDGKYRRLPNKKDNINAADFDFDGDGEISPAEFGQAVLAEKLGGVYPGMKVGKGAGAPAKGGINFFEDFKSWKTNRASGAGP